MLPGPDPVPLEVSVIHGTLVVAVQVQPAPAFTAMLPDPPAAPTGWPVGLIATEQPVPCVTFTVWPATVSVPVRIGPLVGCAAYVTVPVPVLCAPLTIESQSEFGFAVQAHCGLLVVTETVRRSPPDDTESASGDTVNWHGAASSEIATC